MTAPRRLSVSRELYVLQDAVEAARILTEALGTDQLGTAYDERRAPHAAAAILVLIGERMRQLVRAVQGDINPYLLLAHHNLEPLSESHDDDTDDPDLHLAEWSPEERIDKAKSEISRAKREQLRRK